MRLSSVSHCILTLIDHRPFDDAKHFNSWTLNFDRKYRLVDDRLIIWWGVWQQDTSGLVISLKLVIENTKQSDKIKAPN